MQKTQWTRKRISWILYHLGTLPKSSRKRSRKSRSPSSENPPHRDTDGPLSAEALSAGNTSFRCTKNESCFDEIKTNQSSVRRTSRVRFTSDSSKIFDYASVAVSVCAQTILMTSAGAPPLPTFSPFRRWPGLIFRGGGSRSG